jgi:hypothetical protein
MATELVSMSRKEIDRLDVIRRVVERRLTQVKAAQLLDLGPATGRTIVRGVRATRASGLGVPAAREGKQPSAAGGRAGRFPIRSSIRTPKSPPVPSSRTSDWAPSSPSSRPPRTNGTGPDWPRGSSPSGRRTGSELLVRPAEGQLSPRAAPAREQWPPSSISSRRTRRNAPRTRPFGQPSVERNALKPYQTGHFYLAENRTSLLGVDIGYQCSAYPSATMRLRSPTPSREKASPRLA